MNLKSKKYFFLLLMTFANIFANAQNNSTINQLPNTGNGILYQDGKIYLVILVLLTIFAGIIFYLIKLDKKISKLENQLK